MSLAEHGGWSTLLGRLTAGEDLEVQVAQAALAEILSGEATPAQIAGFVVALRQKGESVGELTGMVRAMQDAAEPLDLPPGAIDIVGAGGATRRRSRALNVSTMASFVAAAAGATVCKHGNRRASSTSGSFDFLEALGIPIDLPAERVAQCVRDAGIGFAFARTFHPAMRFAAPVRAELGIPTVFNILGPLSHPGRVRRQVVGVADATLGSRMVEVLRANGAERVLVVTSEGLDELGVSGPSTMVQLHPDGSIQTTTITPADVGLAETPLEELPGGDAEVNRDIAVAVFAGAPGPARDIVVLNAAAGLVVAGVAAHMDEAVERAAAAIDEGRAASVVERLREVASEG